MTHWKKHRGFIALAALLLAGLSAGAAVYMLPAAEPPDPATASRESLFRYLVTGEVDAEPEAYRTALVDRLLAEYAESPSLVDGAESVPVDYRERFDRNLRALEQTWFYSRGQRYDGLPPAERPAYLDRQIEVVLTWSRLDLTADDNRPRADDSPKRSSDAAGFFDRIEDWIADATPQQAPLLETAVQDAILRWMATRDLQEEPMAIRQELARRIIDQIEQGLQLGEIGAGLQHAEREQLTANCLILIEAWLHELAVEYEQLPAERRDAYVDRRMQQVGAWNLARLISAGQGAPSQSTSAFGNLQTSLKLLGVLTQWIARADDESRPRFEALVMHLQRRWLAQQHAR